MPKQIWEEAFYVPLEQLEPSPLNPNVMTQATLEALVTEIETDGFDEPIIVVKHPTEAGKYRIINGEHRYQVAKILGYPQIPVILKAWDEATQKLKIVRRNILRGDIDSALLASLVSEIEREHSLSAPEISVGMGFANTEEMLAKAAAAETKTLPEATQEKTEQRNVKRVVDGVEQALAHVLAEYGSTCPNGFMFFLYGGKMHLAVDMNKDLKGIVETIVRHCEKENKPVAEILETVLGEYVVDVVGEKKKKVKKEPVK